MFLDASAIIAIMTSEPESAALAMHLDHAQRSFISPIAIYETVLGLSRIGNMSPTKAQNILDSFLEEVGAEIIPISAEIGLTAIQAFERFGKGHHPAALNMGDCFAYACAQALRTPLLFKGDDFPLTDIAILGHP
jgi:ribonuclease VapC